MKEEALQQAFKYRDWIGEKTNKISVKAINLEERKALVHSKAIMIQACYRGYCQRKVYRVKRSQYVSLASFLFNSQ